MTPTVRGRLATARQLVNGYAMLTADQRTRVVAALDDGIAEIARLERALDNAGNPRGYRTEFPVSADLSTYLDAALGLICNAHRATVDHVTEADGASPGWAEAARKWIDAYPPKPANGHDEFAAEVARIRERDELFAANKRLERERDQARADLGAETSKLRQRCDLLTEQLNQRDTEITKRRESYREMRAERDKAVHQADKMRADRDEANGLTKSLITARDKANHRYRQEKARANRYRDDVMYAEHRLELVYEAVRTPRQHAPTMATGAPDSELRAEVREVRDDAMRHIRAGDEDTADEVLGAGYRRLFSTDTAPPEGSWSAFKQERAELADQLAKTPGRVVHIGDSGNGSTFRLTDVYWYAVETDAGNARYRELFPDEPGPRPGPVPARDRSPSRARAHGVRPDLGEATDGPTAVGHSPSAHALGQCPCQTGDRDQGRDRIEFGGDYWHDGDTNTTEVNRP